MTNVLIWWKVLIIGEAKHVGGGGRGYMGNLCTFNSIVL